MRRPEDITRALAQFDGTHTAPLRDVLQDDLSPEARATLVAAIPGPDEVAATWLIKALVERGQLGTGQVAQVFEAFAKIAQYAPDAAPILRPHLTPYYGSSKILLRVWAFDAYCRGAPPDEDLSARIRQGLRMREASMRARSKVLAQDFGVDLENDP